MYQYINKIVTIIFVHNWIAILYFNFKKLPFKQAIKLPFDFYYKVRFKNLKGKIIIKNENIHRGMIKIGGQGSEMFPRNPVIIDISGTWIIKGITAVGIGSYIHVASSATLTTGNKVKLGALNKLYCEKSITLGDEIAFSWECQIFDTNFHYMKDLLSNKILEKDTLINIGSFNWIGNRCSIMKGTITPNNVIIASNSLCNKDYSLTPEFSVLAGSPAKVVKNNIKRLFEGTDI